MVLVRRCDDDDVSVHFVPSYPIELTLFMVSMYVVAASSRGASIVLLKLGALKQRGRGLVMIAWALLGSAAKFLVMSVCLADVLLSHSPERSLLLDPRRRVCVDPYLGEGRKADLFL